MVSCYKHSEHLARELRCAAKKEGERKPGYAQGLSPPYCHPAPPTLFAGLAHNRPIRLFPLKDKPNRKPAKTQDKVVCETSLPKLQSLCAVMGDSYNHWAAASHTLLVYGEPSCTGHWCVQSSICTHVQHTARKYLEKLAHGRVPKDSAAHQDPIENPVPAKRTVTGLKLSRQHLQASHLNLDFLLTILAESRLG